MNEDGIWVRLTLNDGSIVAGFAPGADTPNDFWVKFRTQLVQLTDVTRTEAQGESSHVARLYVNRAAISVVELDTPTG